MFHVSTKFCLTMSCDNDKIETLKVKLKHVLLSSNTVTKRRLSTEREVLKLRNKERSLLDELNSLKGEVEFFTDQLEMLKKQLTQSRNQISLIEICTSSEQVKLGGHTLVLNEHLESFQKLFDKEEKELEIRIKEQKEKEAKNLEVIHQKEMEIAKENETQEKEVAAIEAESDAIERECAVLKKRNHALLLKLRKRLLEAENLRRQRIKQMSQTSTYNK